MTTAALTPKQQRFVEEYLVDLNGAQAARRAGYSPKTAHVIGAENLLKPIIQAAIAEGRKKQSERTQVTADRVVRGLLDEATYHGEDTSHAARVSAWAHLGKHLGMFKDKSDVTFSQDDAYKELLALAKERRKEMHNGHAS